MTRGDWPAARRWGRPRPGRDAGTRAALLAACLAASLVMAPPAASQTRPPLRGGVEHDATSDPGPRAPARRESSEAICERHAARVKDRAGRLHVMPKAGGGSGPVPQGRPQETWCRPPEASWEFLGEDRGSCCYFAAAAGGGPVVGVPGGGGPDQTPPPVGPGGVPPWAGIGPGRGGPGGLPPGAPDDGTPPRRRQPPRRTPPGQDAETPPPRDARALQAGLQRGFDECLKSLPNIGLAALAAVNPQYILQNRNYSEAARLLGVRTGDQGLRFLFNEITHSTLRGGFQHEEACDRSVGDEEAGYRIAKRICFWSMPNPVYKALRGAPRLPRPPPGRPGSPGNPLEEADILEIFDAATHPRSPPGARDLAGKTVRLPAGEGRQLGTVTLGQRLGEGKFKDVYAVEGRPDLVVQLLHDLEEGGQSVSREVTGYHLIKGDIPTPTVHGYRDGGATGLSYLVRDRLPGNAFVSEPTADVLSALGGTHRILVNGNRVWVDNHLANHYVIRNTQGRIVGAGIHDTDLITRASDPAIAPQLTRLLPLAQRQGPAAFQRLWGHDCSARAGTLDATVFMRDVWQLRYGTAPPF